MSRNGFVPEADFRISDALSRQERRFGKGWYRSFFGAPRAVKTFMAKMTRIWAYFDKEMQAAAGHDNSMMDISPHLDRFRRYRLHDFGENHDLSEEDLVFAQHQIDLVQSLYDSAPDYVATRSLDSAIAFPGNEWETIVPQRGYKIFTARNDINRLRLHAPFAGYHLAILDRMDSGQRFHSSWSQDILNMVARGIPDDFAAQISEKFDAYDRLVPDAAEYHAHVKNVPRRFIVATPRLFGEVGIEIDGVLVNPDVILCQSRINGLLSAGILRKLDADIATRGKARVIEIGAGYGALAHALRCFYGDKLEYIVVDLPTSLFHAAVYLGVLARRSGCTVLSPGDDVPDTFLYLFICNHLLDEFLDRLGPSDLALNTMSFSEMSKTQVVYYGHAIRKILRPDGVLFEENAVVHPHHTDAKEIFKSIFPYRKHVASDIVMTKNWCQDVWAANYVGEIFDRSDHAVQS